MHVQYATLTVPSETRTRLNKHSASHRVCKWPKRNHEKGYQRTIVPMVRDG
jgi:hypothetical protein